MGQLINYRDYDENNGQLDLIETLNSQNDTIQQVQYAYGDSGNLMNRHDQRQGLSEAFTYDALDRLTSSRISGVLNAAKPYTDLDVDYDGLGNITYKSDIGNYDYQSCHTRLHAVCSAGGNEYRYDANGNLSHLNNVEIITYNGFDKATRISKNGSTIEFGYNAAKRNK